MKLVKHTSLLVVVFTLTTLASCGSSAGKTQLTERVTQIPANIYCMPEKSLLSIKFEGSATLDTNSGNVTVTPIIKFYLTPGETPQTRWGCYAEGFLDGDLVQISLELYGTELQEFVDGYRECGHEPVPAVIEIVDDNDNGFFDNTDTIRVISFSIPSCPTE